jgi:hypothetical protein
MASKYGKRSYAEAREGLKTILTKYRDFECHLVERDGQAEQNAALTHANGSLYRRPEEPYSARFYGPTDYHPGSTGDLRTLSGYGIEHIECRRTVDGATTQSYSHVKLTKVSHPSPWHS